MIVNILKINSSATLRRIKRTRHWLILISLFTISSSCYCENHGEGISDKVYFHIPEDQSHIVIPITLSDSIQANLDFDTAGSFVLDSSFCTQNKVYLGKPIEISKWGSAWEKEGSKACYYSSPINVKIGNNSVTYNRYLQMDYRSTIRSKEDGLINFPEKDSTHIWELNFEKGYIQIYPVSLLACSKDIFFIPMEIQEPGRYYINLPISLGLSTSHKMKRKWKCLIDTGMYYDIALINNAQEIGCLDQKKDAIWTCSYDGYNCRYNVTATVFDKFKIDSLRLYTFSYPVGSPSVKYILGLNFLKHFNLFFDFKNKRLGLQPIDNYKRVYRPLASRYHFRIETNKNGKNIITHIGDYEKNYIKKAGLKVGDEIISIDGIDYNKITVSEGDRIMKMDMVKYQIRRQGRIKEIIVHTDKSEKQGD